MEWTDIQLTVAQKDAEQAEAAATMIAEGGIYIEDYSDLEQQVAEIAHVDLIEPELLAKPRDVVIIHIYLEPGAQPAETLGAIQARMEATESEIKRRRLRRTDIDRFIGDMMRQPEIITTFDPILWSTMVERVTVYSKMDVRFTFRNGTEIAA